MDTVGTQRPVALKTNHCPAAHADVAYCVECRGLLDGPWQVLTAKGRRHKDPEDCERIKRERGLARTASV